jgi:hypothetical protein
MVSRAIVFNRIDQKQPFAKCSDHFARQPRPPEKAAEETGSVSKSGFIQEFLNRRLGMWRISALKDFPKLDLHFIRAGPMLPPPLPPGRKQ